MKDSLELVPRLVEMLRSQLAWISTTKDLPNIFGVK
jgi:hypothetical protein